MFHNYYRMGKYYIRDTSKSEKLDFTSSMGVLQEIICIIDQINLNSWYIQLIKYLFSTGNHNCLTVSIKPIKHGLMNTIIIFIHNKSPFQDIYTFNGIQNALFTIIIYWTWSHVNVLLTLLRLVMQLLLHVKFSYFLLGRK